MILEISNIVVGALAFELASPNRLTRRLSTFDDAVTTPRSSSKGIPKLQLELVGSVLERKIKNL